MQRILPLFGLCLLPACKTSPVGIEPFPRDVFQPMMDSPLLLDVGDPEPPLPAPDPAPRIGDDSLVELNFGGMPLSKAVELIADRAGVNIYLDADLDTPVFSAFPSITLHDALTNLLDRNQLRLARGAGDVYWVEPADGNDPALETFQLRSIAASEVIANLQLLAPGSTVIADPERNFVMLRGTSGDADAVRDYLDGVDRLKQQVLIEAHLFEVSLDDDYEFEVRGDFVGSISGDVATIIENFSTPGGGFSATLEDDDFNVTIEALRRYVRLELLSSPRVLAVTNTDASIDVVTQVPYVETTTVTSGTTGGVGSTTQEAVQFIEAGIQMQVRPTIQEGGVLQIALTQELSEVVDFFNEIPVLDTRTISSQFLVGDGQTIVLGGLMQDNHTETDEGVPLLMHIPIIGQLFRRDADSVRKRELLLFVTPRILDPAQAARVAPYYQDRYRDARRMLDQPMLDEFVMLPPRQSDELEEGELPVVAGDEIEWNDESYGD